jgi:hypothetical protein
MPEEDSLSKKNVSGKSGTHAAIGHKDAAGRVAALVGGVE